MPWGRLDDGLYDHPKVDSLPRGSRLACVGLHVLAISWSNRFLTDGVVPDERIRRFGGTPAHRRALLAVGMWEESPGGIQIHDFAVYNPTKAQVMADRDVARRRAAMNANPSLQRAIRARDGSSCRYCGVVVNWKDRKGPDGGTYDHVLPVVAGGDESVANLVVTCRSCNERKGPRTPDQASMVLLEPGEKPYGRITTGSGRDPAGITTGSSRNQDTPSQTRPDPSHLEGLTRPSSSQGARAGDLVDPLEGERETVPWV